MKETFYRLLWLISWSLIPLGLLTYIFLKDGKIWGVNIKDIQNIMVMALSAIPACVLWYYRDKTKQIDQKHVAMQIEIDRKEKEWNELKNTMQEIVNEKSGIYVRQACIELLKRYLLSKDFHVITFNFLSNYLTGIQIRPLAERNSKHIIIANTSKRIIREAIELDKNHEFKYLHDNKDSIYNLEGKDEQELFAEAMADIIKEGAIIPHNSNS